MEKPDYSQPMSIPVPPVTVRTIEAELLGTKGFRAEVMGEWFLRLSSVRPTREEAIFALKASLEEYLDETPGVPDADDYSQTFWAHHYLCRAYFPEEVK